MGSSEIRDWSAGPDQIAVLLRTWELHRGHPLLDAYKRLEEDMIPTCWFHDFGHA
jgi:hypothetical protein